MWKKTISVFLATIAITGLLGTGSAQAKVEEVARFSLAGKTLRAYDDPALARGGRDGHCYWGIDNPKDYACTVDKFDNHWKLIVRQALGSGFIMVPKVGRRSFDANPYFSGQLPYCMPEWYASGLAYHSHSVPNLYLCAFWKP